MGGGVAFLNNGGVLLDRAHNSCVTHLSRLTAVTGPPSPSPHPPPPGCPYNSSEPNREGAGGVAVGWQSGGSRVAAGEARKNTHFQSGISTDARPCSDVPQQCEGNEFIDDSWVICR